MTGGVTGRIEYGKIDRADIDDVALGNLEIESRNACRLFLRSDDARIGEFRFEPRHALHVIGVMMCEQDVGEPPLVGFERGENGSGIRRIDSGRRARPGIVDENAVIVGEAGQLMDVNGHCPIPSAIPQPSLAVSLAEINSRGNRGSGAPSGCRNALREWPDCAGLP